MRGSWGTARSLVVVCLAALSMAGCASLEEQVRGKVEFILPTQEAQPGDVIKFDFKLPPDVRSGKVIFQQKSYALFKRKEFKDPIFSAFIAVPWETVPGDYTLTTVFQVTGLRQELRETFPFQVVPIVHSSELDKVRNKSFNRIQWNEDYQAIQAALANGGTKIERLQDMILPLGGQVRAVFGTNRIYNGKDTVTIEGMEIEPLAHGNTWDVRSASEGRVLLTQKFPMLGNVVLIDHGYSFVTLYAHLQTILVKPGQAVTRGTVLGRAGRTGGAAVGNRLLFQVFVAGIPVNVKKVMDIATH